MRIFLLLGSKNSVGNKALLLESKENSGGVAILLGRIRSLGCMPIYWGIIRSCCLVGCKASKQLAGELPSFKITLWGL